MWELLIEASPLVFSLPLLVVSLVVFLAACTPLPQPTAQVALPEPEPEPPEPQREGLELARFKTSQPVQLMTSAMFDESAVLASSPHRPGL